MEGRATAPAAGTVLNALATGYGSAFAIDAGITATVELADGPEGRGKPADTTTDSTETRDGEEADSVGGTVTGEVVGVTGADTRLVERCVELVTGTYGEGRGGWVRTDSEVPMAAGLKSSSAAANASIVATLEALDIDVTDDPAMADGTTTVLREDAARLGVRAARDVGVTVTGAFDDASASMLGGVTVTDNHDDDLLARDAVDWDVLVWTPPEQAYSADADVDRCKRVAPLADLAYELAVDGQFERALTVNGFAFCVALDFSTEPLIEALPDAAGVSLSGTGPSYTAVGERTNLEAVRDKWDKREGDTWLTTTQTTGTRTT